jgi:hypothetical protein
MKRIFIGGYATSGSRVPPMILERAGYYVGKDFGPSYDCGASTFPVLFRAWNADKSEYNEKRLKDFFDEQVTGKDSWALKHGHMMLMVPKLKSWYPSSTFILTVRHPLDQMNRWRGFGSLKEKSEGLTPDLERYAKLHNEALNHTDLIWRLEDVCFDAINSIKKLLTFAEIDDDPNKYVDLIKVSETVGMFRNPIIKKLGYD